MIKINLEKSESLKAVLVLNTTDNDLEALKKFVAATTTSILYERVGKPKYLLLGQRASWRR